MARNENKCRGTEIDTYLNKLIEHKVNLVKPIDINLLRKQNNII